MNVNELIEEVCKRGIESAKKKERGSKLEGAIKGFELCRKVKNLEDLFALLESTSEAAKTARHAYHDDKGDLEDYWKALYCKLQVEFVYEVVNVGLHIKPTCSARAALVYSEIVGVKYES